jgi:hypothetical protein
VTDIRTARGVMMEYEYRQRVARTWLHRHNPGDEVLYPGPYCDAPEACPQRVMFETLPAVMRMMTEMRKPLAEIL